MEPTYNGRAIVEDNFDSVIITIPSRKNYLVIIFLCAWLCGWAFGEVSVINEIRGSLKNGADFFQLFWVIGWTIGGLFALKTIRWQLTGKEIIKVGKGVLTIIKHGDWLGKPIVYDLNACKSFRVQDDSMYANSNGYNSFRGLIKNNNTGTILFDYGMQTIRFGEFIDEAEGKYLINLLASKKLLTPKNLN